MEGTLPRLTNVAGNLLLLRSAIPSSRIILPCAAELAGAVKPHSGDLLHQISRQAAAHYRGLTSFPHTRPEGGRMHDTLP
jgi:hypothetical protein